MNNPKRYINNNQLAKNIVDLTTGDTEEVNQNEGKYNTAVALGRKGGLNGGKARAANMKTKERNRAARKAALTRWKKKKEQS